MTIKKDNLENIYDKPGKNGEQFYLTVDKDFFPSSDLKNFIEVTVTLCNRCRYSDRWCTTFKNEDIIIDNPKFRFIVEDNFTISDYIDLNAVQDINIKIIKIHV